MNKTIVEVRDMRKVYNAWSLSGRRRVSALNGVSLSADGGEVFGLLGPNGAGKTTLIKILLGVIKPSGGEGTLFDQPLGSTSARSRVGYLPESLRVDRHHTARSALKFYGRMSRMSGAEITRRSDELLELVDLRNRDKESVRQFSKGMYQRLGLAQALLHDPDLLVLDEPTDGLDPVGRSSVRQIIERLRDQGKTIFLNSHILQEVELVCSRVAIMSRGVVRGIGTIDELSGSTDAQQVDMLVSLPTQENQDSVDVIAKVTQCVSSVFESPEVSMYDSAAENPGLARLRMNTKDQSEVDRAIDLLRENSFSIHGLQVKRPTLEDTFIRLVNQAEAEANMTAQMQNNQLQEAV